MALLAGIFTQTAIAQITVAGSNGANGNYSSFTKVGGAFAALNGTSQAGQTIVILITGDVTDEDGLTALTGTSGMWTTLTISPSGARIISGSPTAPLIDLNGADNVTVDGLNSGGNSLTISNTSLSAISGTSTIRFINDASNNTVKNCIIKGSPTAASGGILLFSTTTGSTGNDGNTIDHNNITTDTDANRPLNVVYSLGSGTGLENSGNTISNNNIYDFLRRSTASFGINLGNHTTAWTITGNSFYETTSFEPTANVEYRVINIVNTSGINFTVSNNFIGGKTALCGGSAWTKTAGTSFGNVFYGFYLSVGTGTASNVIGNTIRNFAYSNSDSQSWYGVYVSAGDVNIGTPGAGNSIGDAIGTGSIIFTAGATAAGFYGINVASPGLVNIQNNTIASITVANDSRFATNFYGIYKSGAGTTTINNNMIGSPTEAGSIIASSTSSNTSRSQLVYGIYNIGSYIITISGNTIANVTNGTNNTDLGTTGLIHGIYIGAGQNTITNNTVHDLTIANANSSQSETASVVGIGLNYTTAGYTQTISGNTIYNLKNDKSDFAGSVIGLYYAGSTTTGSVSGNFIYGLSVNASSTTANLFGIKISSGSTTYFNNIISLGGNTQTSLCGIYETGAASNNNNLYFNTVHISGNLPTGAANKSFALYSAVTTNTRNFRNNIFSNARSTVDGGGSSLHYAMYIFASGGTVTCDYNDYWVSGTGGKLGYYGADKSAKPIVTSQDVNSLATDPAFTSPGTTSASYYPTASSLPGITVSSVVYDYNETTRPATPKMGALESASATKNVDVYIGDALQASYTNIRTAFDKINDGTHKGTLILKITGSQVLYSNARLNASGTGYASYSSVNIYPAATGLAISGNLAAPLIDLDGADNVTIDGRVGATGLTKDLVITNTSISGTNTSTIRLINDASGNTIKYCTIKGSAVNTTGILFFSTTTGTSGNDGNTIDNNNITNAADANRSISAIYSLGTSTKENSGNTISNNNIYDFFNHANDSYGINLGNFTTAWTISGNSFYETASFVPTASKILYAIFISNTSGVNFTVSNNFIGGNSAQCGGTPWTKTSALSSSFIGINLSVGTGTASNIQGNTIRNFSFSNSVTGYWYGIYIGAGDVNIGTITGNTIGAATGNGSIAFTAGANWDMFVGINLFTSGISNVQNNTIGAINVSNDATTDGSGFAGIKKNNSFGTTTISNNTIGSTETENSINVSSASTGYSQNIHGIYSQGKGTNTISGNTISKLTNGTINANAVYTGGIDGIVCSDGANTISNNTIRDLTTANANNNATYQASVMGIQLNCSGSSSGQTITGNTVYGLSNSYDSFTGSVIGLYYYGPTVASTVANNFIRTLSVTGANSTTSNIYGIKIDGGTTTYSNNIVTLGGTTKTTIYGIYEEGGANSLYFNTVHISGDLASGVTNQSFAFSNKGTANAVNFRNNIFSNTRSTTGGVSLHYAAFFTPPTSGTLTCDYNNYLASGTGGKLGYYGGDKSALPIVTSQDGNSTTTNPLFVKEKGVSPTDYIPAGTGLSAIAGTGITTDYRGTVTRSGSPFMGAWDYGNNLLVWDGSETTDWGTPANWTPGTAIPNGGNNLVIPNVPNKPVVNEAIGSPALCNNIVIASDSKITIASAKAMTVNGNLINYADSTGLVINSDETGTGSLIISGSVSGSGSIKRYMVFDRWHLLSSPTGTQTIKDFIAKNVDIPVFTPPGTIYGMRDYSTSSVSEWNSYFTTDYLSTNSSQEMGVGKGYLVRTITNATPFKLRFQGVLNSTEAKSILVSRSGDNGWNCIGNPYTSAIKIYDGTVATGTDNFIDVNAGNFDPTYYGAYFWNDVDKKYDIINKSSDVSTYAQVGQGFFVRKKDDASVTAMSVTPAMQFHQGAEALKSVALLRPEIQLVAIKGDIKVSTDIKFIDGTSEGLDVGYDAGILKADPTFAIYSKLVKDIGTEFQLQCLPTNQYNNLVIPVGIDCKAGGEIVLSVNTVQLDPSCKVILEDRLTNTFKDLSKGNYKAAVAANTAGSGRFFLHTGDIVSGLEDQVLEGKLTAYAKGNKEIRVLGEVGEGAVATLVNGLGQVMLTKKMGAGNLNIIGLPNLTSGLYLLNINDKGTPQTIKVMVRK